MFSGRFFMNTAPGGARDIIMSQPIQNLHGALLGLLAFACFALHDVVIKYAGAHYSAFQIVFFSVLLGFPIVTVMLLRDRTDGNLVPRHPWWMLARTISASATGVMAFYAFGVLPLAQTYAILFTMPLLITLMAVPVLGERVGVRRGLAVLIGLIGVLIVLRPGQVTLGLGHAGAMLAAVGAALSSVITRKIGHAERSVVLLLYPMMGSFLLMACAMPFVYVPVALIDLGAFAVIAVLAFSASLLIILAYRRAEAVIVAPMQYSQILWATGYGYFLFDETIDLGTAVGAGVIIASGLYILFREGRDAVSDIRPVQGARLRPDMGTTLRQPLPSLPSPDGGHVAPHRPCK